MAYTDREDLNYLGQLYQIGQTKTPFLNMIGGLQAGAKVSRSFDFPVAQPWNLNSASQNATSEELAAAAGTAVTYTRAQDYNTAQIMKYDYAVTFAKQSTYNEISGLSIAGDQPVKDELAFQKTAAMKQMAVDLEYSFLQGSYVAQSASNTVAKTRGILEAISTNEVAGGAVTLTKEMIDELLRKMATNGADFENVVIFANALQRQIISSIYAYAPESRNVGGYSINQIETDFGILGVQYAPFMPTDDVLFAEMSVCYPVFVPSYKGQIIADVPTAITAAKQGGFLYTQVGLDYGPEEYHGKITNLATI